MNYSTSPISLGLIFGAIGMAGREATANGKRAESIRAAGSGCTLQFGSKLRLTRKISNVSQEIFNKLCCTLENRGAL